MRRLEKRKVVVDDDWSVLQHCLSANQATGDLLLQVVVPLLKPETLIVKSTNRLNLWTSRFAMHSLMPLEGFSDLKQQSAQHRSSTTSCSVTKHSARLFRSYMRLLWVEQVEPAILSYPQRPCEHSQVL